MKKKVRQKPHRLPEEDYIGNKRIYVTACEKNRKRIFDDPEVVEAMISCLKRSLIGYDSTIPIYCFMPDHMHMIVSGNSATAMPKKAISKFKQLSGYWILKNRPQFEWQERFFDRIIRNYEEWTTKATYIAQNPVRAGLVSDPRDYPHLGTVGYDSWVAVLQDLAKTIDPDSEGGASGG